MRRFKRLYLHVGSEKTGTTSIQRALHEHRERLCDLNFYYPKTFAVGRNLLFATMFHRDPLSIPLWKVGIDAYGGSQQSLRDALAVELENELENVRADNLIISSEFLAVRAEVDQLKAYCDELADETKVVLYLREPVSLLLSVHSTLVKSGGQGFPALDELDRGAIPSRIHAQRNISRLLDHFERSDLHLRLFEKERLVNGSAVDDFVSLIGLDDYLGDFAVGRENVSLSREAIPLLELVNDYLPPIVDGKRSTARTRLIEELAALDSTGMFGRRSLPAKYVELVRKVTEPGNEWVRQNFFPDQSQLFATAEHAETEAEPETAALAYAAQLIARAFERVDELEAAIAEKD